MNSEIYMKCANYSADHGCTFLEAFASLYENSDMPYEEYKALYDHIQDNQDDFLYG